MSDVDRHRGPAGPPAHQLGEPLLFQFDVADVRVFPDTHRRQPAPDGVGRVVRHARDGAQPAAVRPARRRAHPTRRSGRRATISVLTVGVAAVIMTFFSLSWLLMTVLMLVMLFRARPAASAGRSTRTSRSMDAPASSRRSAMHDSSACFIAGADSVRVRGAGLLQSLTDRLSIRIDSRLSNGRSSSRMRRLRSAIASTIAGAPSPGGRRLGDGAFASQRARPSGRTGPVFAPEPAERRGAGPSTRRARRQIAAFGRIRCIVERLLRAPLTTTLMSATAGGYRMRCGNRSPARRTPS